MSSTNKSNLKKDPNQFYPTPAHAVYSFMAACPEYQYTMRPWIEPAVGDGAIIEAVQKYADKFWNLPAPRWTANDIDISRLPFVLATRFADGVSEKDFLKMTFEREQFSVSITNAAFTLAERFVEKSLDIASDVILLQRLGFMGGQDRNKWWQKYLPSKVLVLSRRPFPDSADYAWYVWGDRRGKTELSILPPWDDKILK